MLALFLALLVAGSAADIPIAEPAYLCPGSPSSANHWAKVEALVFAYCDSVRDEIIARVDLQVRRGLLRCEWAVRCAVNDAEKYALNRATRYCPYLVCGGVHSAFI